MGGRLGRGQAEDQVDHGGPGVAVTGLERRGGGVLGEQPTMSATMPAARWRSLVFAASTSTIRSPWTRPNRTIAAVVSALSATFWAVPAVSRVDSRSTSGPAPTSTTTSGDAAQGSASGR